MPPQHKNITDTGTASDVRNVLGMEGEGKFVHTICGLCTPDYPITIDGALESSMGAIISEQAECYASNEGEALMQTLKMIVSVYKEGLPIVKSILHRVDYSIRNRLEGMKSQRNDMDARGVSIDGSISEAISLLDCMPAILENGEDYIDNLLQEVATKVEDINKMHEGEGSEPIREILRLISLYVVNLKAIKSKQPKLRQLQESMKELRYKGVMQYEAIVRL